MTSQLFMKDLLSITMPYDGYLEKRDPMAPVCNPGSLMETWWSSGEERSTPVCNPCGSLMETNLWSYYWVELNIFVGPATTTAFFIMVTPLWFLCKFRSLRTSFTAGRFSHDFGLPGELPLKSNFCLTIFGARFSCSVFLGKSCLIDEKFQ